MSGLLLLVHVSLGSLCCDYWSALLIFFPVSCVLELHLIARSRMRMRIVVGQPIESVLGTCNISGNFCCFGLYKRQLIGCYGSLCPLCLSELHLRGASFPGCFARWQELLFRSLCHRAPKPRALPWQRLLWLHLCRLSSTAIRTDRELG